MPVRMVQLNEREVRAIEKRLKAHPDLWNGISDWVHQAVRDSLRDQEAEDAGLRRIIEVPASALPPRNHRARLP